MSSTNGKNSLTHGDSGQLSSDQKIGTGSGQQLSIIFNDPIQKQSFLDVIKKKNLTGTEFEGLRDQIMAILETPEGLKQRIELAKIIAADMRIDMEMFEDLKYTYFNKEYTGFEAFVAQAHAMPNTTEKVIGLSKNENSAQYTWMMSQTQNHPKFSKMLMRLGLCGKGEEVFLPDKQELQKKMLDFIKECLSIQDTDTDYLIEIETKIATLLYNVFKNIHIYDGEPKGVFETALKCNIDLGLGMNNLELVRVSNIITDYIKTDKELMNKSNNEIENIKNLCKDNQIIGLYDIINEYPGILGYNQKTLISLIEKGVKEFKFLGRGVNGFIISIGDEKVVKLGVSQIDRNSEVFNQALFYEALEKIIKKSDISNISIPFISDSGDGYIEMQKIKGNTLLHYSILDFFKKDLEGIGNVIKDAKVAENRKIKYIYQRLLSKGVNMNSDIDVVNCLNDEDLKNIFIYKQRVGSLKTDMQGKSVHDSLYVIGRATKQEAIERSVRYICLQNGITEENDIIGYYKKLQNQIKEAEEQLRHYGLKHDDFHQGNVMIERNNDKEDFILHIIDFGKVEINRKKNKIKMEE